MSTVPTVTLGIVTGTPGGGAPIAPAETDGVYVFPLATIAIPALYGSSGFGIEDAWITSVWRRSFVAASHVRAVTGSAFGAGVSGVLEPVSPEPDWSRFGASRTYYVPFRHRSDAVGTATLGGRVAALDWRNRTVKLTMLRAASDGGEYKRPHAVSVAGASVNEESGLLYTGTGGSLWVTARGFVFTVNGSGALTVSKTGGDPPDTGNTDDGDNLLLIIEASDRLI